MSGIDTNSKLHKGLVYFTGCLLFINLGVSVAQIDRIGRDHSGIANCYRVIAEVGKNTTINICADMFTNWSLHSYYARYGNVS